MWYNFEFIFMNMNLTICFCVSICMPNLWLQRENSFSCINWIHRDKMRVNFDECSFKFFFRCILHSPGEEEMCDECANSQQHTRETLKKWKKYCIFHPHSTHFNCANNEMLNFIFRRFFCSLKKLEKKAVFSFFLLFFMLAASAAAVNRQSDEWR